MLTRARLAVAKAIVRLRFPREGRIPTHLTAAEKLALYRLARTAAGEVCVEVGSYLGASSCFLAAGLRRGRGGRGLTCVDTWHNDAMSEGSRDTYEAFLANTAPYRDLITPIRAASAEAAAAFSRGVDLLFLDGDHSYEGVREDVDAWFPKLNPGALVLFHDVGWAEGVQRIVRERVAPRATRQGRLPNLCWAWL